MGNHYDDFAKETEPTARWQNIERLVDPAYYRYHHRDYTEEVGIVPDCEIRVLTSNKEAQENIPLPINWRSDCAFSLREQAAKLRSPLVHRAIFTDNHLPVNFICNHSH